MTEVRGARLSDLGSALTITRGFPTQRALQHGDVRVMSIAALRNMVTPKAFAEREAMQDLGIDVAKPGDLLVAIEGGTVGETLVVTEDHEEFVPSQQVATLRLIDDARVDPWYLGAWLTMGPAREQLRRLARGLGIQRIPIKDLGSIMVRLPDLASQREIGQRFRAFESSIRSHRAEVACLEQLRDLDLVVVMAAKGVAR